MTNSDHDIIPSFHFRVLFTGLKGVTDLDTRFESVSGIQGSRADEIAGAGKKKEKDSSTTSFQPLVLKRAALAPQASVLLQWVLQCLNTRSYPALPSVQVQVLNELQQPQLTINFTEVRLKTWVLGGLDARVSGLLMEEFYLDYQSIAVTQG